MILTSVQQLQAPANSFLRNELSVQQRAQLCFQQASDLLSEFSLPQFLQQLMGPKSSEILKDTYGYVHLGLLAPQSLTAELFEELAQSNGFTQHQAVIASEVMAIELAGLQGGEPVPTSIHKAFTAAQEASGIEIFRPAVSEEKVLSWIKAGVGNHIGIGLKKRDAVYRAVEMCREVGFSPPEFLQGGPAVNSAEEILVYYTDGPLQNEPIRLEFYHSRSEVARYSASLLADG